MQQDHRTKQDLIRGLVAAGRTRELKDLLVGLSPFSDRSAKGALELAPIAETKLVAAARNHLEFVSKFGFERSHVTTEGGTHHFAYPEKFEEWVRIGAPGVSLAELTALSSG